ncbi:hypothetical protein [Streptomyces sp. NPDC001657]|uniref:hypothetical protein n=1 Tax=Streptomyces sp. NPDC001657 TaxID=3154522 RepID=UPI0033209A0E
MVNQLVTVAGPCGVLVCSGSGFNGLPAKQGAALRAGIDRGGLRIFVISAWDQSGVHLFLALAQDVAAFAAVEAPAAE